MTGTLRGAQQRHNGYSFPAATEGAETQVRPASWPLNKSRNTVNARHKGAVSGNE
jgi:hypothetical protein